MAKRQAPEGRHEIARGLSPASDQTKKHKPRRGGTNNQPQQGAKKEKLDQPRMRKSQKTLFVPAWSWLNAQALCFAV
jgi:hypothetical protein